MDTTSNSPSQRGGRALDPVIERMLNNQPDPERPDYCSHERETQDSSRLENLCLTTYSGDTKVLVEFPRGSSYVNCGGRAWRSKEFLVDSGKLLRTGSAVFARLLSPEQQARTRRRLEVAPDDHEGFVLDMTPPPEGDELAARLAGLSLPPGVRDWWMAKRRLGVSRYLVSGHDDHCPRHLEVDVDCQETPGRAPPDHDEDNEMLDLEDVLSSQPRKIHDYCPIRHRVNIIRLLLAIQGEELILNSAPRVYTLVDIAKSLDCTGVIRDSVFIWFLAQPNSQFVELNPEAAAGMAWKLQIADVARAALRVLVAERALEALAAPAPGARLRTVFGRAPADLPPDDGEIIGDAVGRAARSLAARARAAHAGLEPDRVLDWLSVPEWRRLRGMSEADGVWRRLFAAAASDLQKYVAACVAAASSRPDDDGPGARLLGSYDRDRRCYVSRRAFVPTGAIYDGLAPAQRLLVPAFWDRLVDRVGSWEDCRDFRPPGSGSGASGGAAWMSLAQTVRSFNVAAERASAGAGAGDDLSQRRFDLRVFHDQLSAQVRALARRWTLAEPEIPLSRTRHMSLCLSQDEFKYLPVWAGGEEDGGSGAVPSSAAAKDTNADAAAGTVPANAATNSSGAAAAPAADAVGTGTPVGGAGVGGGEAASVFASTLASGPRNATVEDVFDYYSEGDIGDVDMDSDDESEDEYEDGDEEIAWSTAGDD